MHFSGLFLIISNHDAVLAERVFEASLISIPIPFVVGNRRFYQGVLIRSAKSILLTFGTAVRLTLIIGVGILLTTLTDLHGAIIGAASGLSGMVGESLLITLVSIATVKSLKSGPQQEVLLTYQAITKFFAPLGLSGVVNLSILPVLTFFMSQSVEPVSSLAGYQVLQGVIFFLSALALGLQEVIVSMLGDKFEGYQVLKNFTLLLAAFVALIFSLYIFTPLSEWILLGMVGIPESLYVFMKATFWIALPTPILTVFAVSMRAVVVAAKKTRWVTVASFTELSVVLISMLTLQFSELNGLACALISLLIARLASCFVYSRIFLNLKSQLDRKTAPLAL